MNNLILKPIENKDIKLIEGWLNKEYIKKWYENPKEWLEEINNRGKKFGFIHHFIVIASNKPIGFCQYYDCFYAKEDWYNVIFANHSFSIDYLIGDEEYLKKGYGTAIIKLLTETIKQKENAIQIIVQPEKDNISSNNALLSAGYRYDNKSQYYYYNIF